MATGNDKNEIVRMGTEDPRMSQIVVHNGTVYISGQVAMGVGIANQTKAVLQKVENLLETAKTSKSRLLSAQIWVKDIDRDFAGMNEVWIAWLDSDNKPVRACTQATLARDHLLVEVQVTAAL